MKKLWKVIEAVCLGLLCLLCWEFFKDCGVNPTIKDSLTVQKVPSLIEIQRMIGAEPDGKWGKETEEKWEQAVCNQEAEEYLK